MLIQIDFLLLILHFSIFNVHFLHRLAIWNHQKWTWKNICILIWNSSHTLKKNQKNIGDFDVFDMHSIHAGKLRLTAMYTSSVFHSSEGKPSLQGHSVEDEDFWTPVPCPLRNLLHLWKMQREHCKAPRQPTLYTVQCGLRARN